ncbi:MAG: hypothetical protein KJO69_06920 [Gammaproteobacteria bacterium]|nr:hypothetical protein [Gammaproteobacteria bacterium]
MYVKWENDQIIEGPQGEAGEGHNWYPYIEFGEKYSNRDTRDTILHEGQVVLSQITNVEPTYAELREYGPLEEQLDKLFHDIDSGTLDKTGQFYTYIKGVKDDIPKPD